jgi:hypothetical protein
LFGYENDNSFVRVVRPFFSVDLSYNDVTGVGYGFGGGIGGSLFRQDNLSLTLTTTKALEELRISILNAYIRYLLF